MTSTWSGMIFGFVGIMYFFAALHRPGFPNPRSNALAAIALASMLLVFLAGLPDCFTSISAATPSQLFGFVGRLFGVAGTVRAFYMRFPHMT